MAWHGLDRDRKVITSGFTDELAAMRAVIVNVGKVPAGRLFGMEREQLAQLMRSIGSKGFTVVHSNTTQVVGKPYRPE